MDNSRIIKSTIPFLILFVLSIGFAIVNYINTSTPKARAAQGYDIDIQNTLAPTDGTSTWNWNILTFVQESSLQNVEVSYDVYWCGESQNAALPCRPTNFDTVTSTLTSGSITIQSRDSVSRIEHPGVECGKVGFHITNGTQESFFNEVDTGIPCSVQSLTSIVAEDGITDDSHLLEQLLVDSLNKIDEIQAILIGEERVGKFDSSGPAFPPDPDTPDPEPVNPNPRLPGPPPGPVPSDPPRQSRVTAEDIANGKKFYDRLYSACFDSATGKSRVNSGNYASCLSRVSNDGIPNAHIAKNWIKIAIDSLTKRGYPDLQCIGFARATYGIFLGRIFEITFTNNYRVAKNLSPNLDSFTYYDRNDSPPVAGDVVKWSHAPDGHVAIVVSTAGDNFRIIQANVGYDAQRHVFQSCKGCLSERGAYRFEADLEGFYRME